MDHSIYEYLKADHSKVDHLFKLFEKTNNLEAKVEYVAMICKELLIHADTEEQTFYTAIDSIAPADKSHSMKEHQEMKNKITEVQQGFTKPNEKWINTVLELKEIVQHHVKEEEGKIFKDAKKVLTPYDAFVVRERMHDLKEKILTQLDALR